MTSDTRTIELDADRRPTLQDVARALNVSVMTVSRALNGHPKVSDETRGRVTAEAERLGYRPNFSARALRSREHKLIGFRSPNLMLPVHIEVIQGARVMAAKEGYRLILQVDPDGGERHDPFTSDGDLIITDAPPLPGTQAPQYAMRTVGLMSRPGVYAIDVCGIDFVQATHDALRHLVATGYRRIGLLQHAGIQPHVGRDGRQVIGGMDEDPSLVQVVANDKESVLRGLHALMALANRPDAIAVVHVAGTPFVLRELQRHNITIGRDIGFVGTEVSQSDWGDLVFPRMTSIRIPAYRIGAEGARRLIARLRGDRSAPRYDEFPAELVVRESTPGPWNPGSAR